MPCAQRFRIWIRLDQAALKAMILAQHEQLQIKDEQLLSREHEIEHLKLLHRQAAAHAVRAQVGEGRSGRSNSWS